MESGKGDKLDGDPTLKIKNKKMSDNLGSLLEGPKEFIRDSIQLVNRCTKPDRRGKYNC